MEVFLEGEEFIYIHEPQYQEYLKRQQKKKGQGEKSQEGYVYIIESGGLYKIGRSQNIKERIRRYITENPFEIKILIQKKVNDCVGKERELLERFKEKRYRGEWFKLNKHDIQWIKENL
ncbi:MAG: GIY-YIG nuclease family protein [Candidatus Hodarchaeales archaeon]